jgi:hypothetical protein
VKPRKRKTAAEKLDAIGIEKVCDSILECQTMTAIAKAAGVDISDLIRWLAADAQRSARAKQARDWTGVLWDEKAEQLLLAAKDSTDVQRARELAHHYRWRSSKIAPRTYGERLEIETPNLPAPRPEERRVDTFVLARKIMVLFQRVAQEADSELARRRQLVLVPKPAGPDKEEPETKTAPAEIVDSKPKEGE